MLSCNYVPIVILFQKVDTRGLYFVAIHYKKINQTLSLFLHRSVINISLKTASGVEKAVTLQ